MSRLDFAILFTFTPLAALTWTKLFIDWFNL